MVGWDIMIKLMMKRVNWNIVSNILVECKYVVGYKFKFKIFINDDF